MVIIYQDLFFFFPLPFPHSPFFLHLFLILLFLFCLFPLSVLISSHCFHGRSNILKHYLKTDLTESAKKAREVGFLLSKLCSPVCLLSCTLIKRGSDRKKKKEKRKQPTFKNYQDEGLLPIKLHKTNPSVCNSLSFFH